MKTIVKVFVLSLLIGTVSPIPLSSFFPFGANYAQDIPLPRNDDSFSSQVSVNTLFFGVRRSVLFVDNNGCLSFNGGVSEYVPQPFPVSNQPLIAPFWGDVDTRPSNGGYVWYSLRGASTIADNIVNTNFPGIAFASTYTFVATWDHVGYYNEHVDRLDTFQAIIVGNNDATFVIYNYLDNGMPWTYGDASSGIPAQVGFDAGNGVNYYAHPLSRTPSVTNIWSQSNIGVPGQFLFLVSAATIQPASPLLVNPPADQTYQCGAVPATFPQPSPTGGCQDGTLVSFHEDDSRTDGTCPLTYTLRRTWTATDKCQRTATGTQTITVVDTVAPVINLAAGASVSYECGTPAPTIVTPGAADSCSATFVTFADTPVASCTGQSFSRTYTATDGCGVSSQKVLPVNVVDTVRPVLIVPQDIEVNCGAALTPDVTGAAEATDSCTAVTVGYTDTGATTCPSTVSRLWTATDGCGNTGTGTQTITIRPVCGDGVVQGGEQCDPPSDCCTETCTFKPATTVCRPTYDICDVPESCTGTSAACPVDGFKPRGTACGELFGMCDVALENSCTGDAPNCHGPPAFPYLNAATSWKDFNVISFDSFTCNGGDVEGRLAVRNRAVLDAFTLGMELTIAVDGWRTFSLFVAGNASWSSGSLYPDGVRNVDTAGLAAYAYVGENFNAPAYLAARLLNNQSAGAIATGFDTAHSYYTSIQTLLSQVAYNAQAALIYGDGLQITCNGVSDLYHVQVDGATWNQIRWFDLAGCKFNSRWVIDITGTQDIVLQGEPFPAIVERVIYNVLGSGRTITGNTGIAAHILAPQNSYTQSNGVTYGILIAGNVVQARQNNKPNCVVFSPVTISTMTLKPVAIGDTTVWVVDLADFVAGDTVCINGDCRKIVSGSVADVDGDGVPDNVVTVDQAFTAQHDSNSFLTTNIADPDNVVRTPLVSDTTPGSPNGSDENSLSSASLFVLSGLLLTLALLFV